MVLWEKTGWQWAGSNQVFLPSHPPFSELTPVNELINLVAALTHSKSLSKLCLGLAHVQSPASVPWGGLGHRGSRGSLGTLVQWGQDRSSLLPPRQTGGFCHFPPLHNQGWGKPVGNYSLENTLLFKASTSFPSAPGQHHPQVYGEGTVLQQPSSLDLTLHPPAPCSSTAQVGPSAAPRG